MKIAKPISVNKKALNKVKPISIDKEELDITPLKEVSRTSSKRNSSKRTSSKKEETKDKFNASRLEKRRKA